MSGQSNLFIVKRDQEFSFSPFKSKLFSDLIAERKLSLLQRNYNLKSIFNFRWKQKEWRLKMRVDLRGLFHYSCNLL